MIHIFTISGALLSCHLVSFPFSLKVFLVGKTISSQSEGLFSNGRSIINKFSQIFLSGDVFISLSFLKDNFTIEFFVDTVFSFSILNMVSNYLLTSIVSNEKSPVDCIVSYMWCTIFVLLLSAFSLFFQKFEMICLCLGLYPSWDSLGFWDL